MTLTCPYCDFENEEPEIDNLEPDDSDDTICESCKRNFTYSYAIVLYFDSKKIEESLEYSKSQIVYLKKRLKDYKKKRKTDQLNIDISHTNSQIESEEREVLDIKAKIEKNKNKEK